MEPKGSGDVEVAGVAAQAQISVFGYEDFIPNRSYDRILDSSIKTESLRPVATAFVENMRRVDQLSQMPLALVSVSTAMGRDKTFQFTSSDRTVPLSFTPGDLPQNDVDKSITVEGVWWLSPYMDNPELLKRRVEEAIAILGIFFVLGGGGPGEQAWLSMLIMGTWTAFETMAGDLWEAAVNSHPIRLALLKGKRRGSNAGPPLPSSDRKGDGKTISMNTLAKHKYRINAMMGTLLREERKVVFDSLYDIRNAYTASFGEEATAIYAAIDHNSLNALSAVRNLIAHKASVCDQKFLHLSRKCPQLPSLEVGQSITLNAPLVAKLIAQAADASMHLIAAVNAWLDKESPSEFNGTGI